MPYEYREAPLSEGVEDVEVSRTYMGASRKALLIASLQSQDMYLAGSFLMFLAILTVIGMLISDLLLAMLDPRIRLQGAPAK